MCTGFSDTVELPFPVSIVESGPSPPMTLDDAEKGELR
jgi:hypothetical protein